jgi:hypothetical protein
VVWNDRRDRGHPPGGSDERKYNSSEVILSKVDTLPMGARFKVAASGFLVTLTLGLLVSAQSRPIVPQRGIVEQLLPDGGVPKDIQVKPEQRDQIIRRLKAEQGTHDARRAQQVAFLMAALNEDYDRNRDYLLHVLLGCDYPEIRYGCDEMTGFYLIYLRDHGHEEILAPMLKASIGSNNAAGSEGLGAYFDELIRKSPEKFLEAVSTFQVPTQKRACYFAGLSDGGGMGAKGVAQVRLKLLGIGSEVALRCLREIEQANKPD